MVILIHQITVIEATLVFIRFKARIVLTVIYHSLPWVFHHFAYLRNSKARCSAKVEFTVDPGLGHGHEAAAAEVVKAMSHPLSQHSHL